MAVIGHGIPRGMRSGPVPYQTLLPLYNSWASIASNDSDENRRGRQDLRLAAVPAGGSSASGATPAGDTVVIYETTTP
jgi:hypothetical protein